MMQSISEKISREIFNSSSPNGCEPGREPFQRIKTAIIGCGKISDIYLENLTGRFRNTVDVVACCARTFAHAEKKAQQYKLQAKTFEEILKDKAIELAVILTPPDTHYFLIKECLQNGKNVYSEKVFAGSFEEACQLQEMAKERGLWLSSAPDTFMSDAIQSARKAIDEGLIGKVTGFSVTLNRNNGYFYERLPFTLQKNAGIGYDLGIYSLTALINLLGCCKNVVGMTLTSRPERSTADGRTLQVLNENIMAAVLQMENGAVGTVYYNGDSAFPSLRSMMIYGTEGVLQLPDPTDFAGDVIFKRAQLPSKEAICEEPLNWIKNIYKDSRGAGVAELAYSIRNKRRSRTDVSMAVHAIEVLDAICRSEEMGKRQQLTSSTTRPTPLCYCESWIDNQV